MSTAVKSNGRWKTIRAEFTPDSPRTVSGGTHLFKKVTKTIGPKFTGQRRWKHVDSETGNITYYLINK